MPGEEQDLSQPLPIRGLMEGCTIEETTHGRRWSKKFTLDITLVNEIIDFSKWLEDHPEISLPRILKALLETLQDAFSQLSEEDICAGKCSITCIVVF